MGRELKKRKRESLEGPREKARREKRKQEGTEYNAIVGLDAFWDASIKCTTTE